MAYLTETLVIQKVGGQTVYLQLVDAADLLSVDTNLKTIYLGQIDAMLDGYARRGGYTAPLAATDSDSILTYLLDIANYKLRTRGNREASEDERKLYDDAIAVLNMIGEGKWEFPSGPPSGDITTEFGMDSEERIFDRTTMRIF